MSERILKRLLNAEIVGLFLTFVALQVILAGVETYLRGMRSEELFGICLVAAIIGVWAGKNKIGGIPAAFLILLLGSASVWIIGARLVNPIVEILTSTRAVRSQLFPGFSYLIEIDIDRFSTAWNVASVSSSALFERWQRWVISVTGGSHLNDVLVYNMLWTFVLWLLAAWSGWFAAKRNAAASLLPGIALLCLLMYNSERRIEALWGAVMLMLLLMGVWKYRELIQQWDSGQFDYSESIRYDNGVAVVLVVSFIGGIAFFTPSISWRDIQEAWRDFERQRTASQVTTGDQPSAGPSSSSQQAPGSAVKPSLPRQHLLTAGAFQSESVVMTIKTGELPPVTMPSLNTVPRYYWRSAVYDQYRGSGWYTASTSPQRIQQAQPLIPGVLGGYRPLHIKVDLQQPDGRLYYTGILYSVNVPVSVDWRVRPHSSLFADQTTLLQADMFSANTTATNYQAEVYVQNPSIEQLRAASTDYPQNITVIYLSLPATLPQRVHQLAQDITRGKETPYDKAQAIELFLRTNYPYDLEIGAPPEDRDVVDYFLFDLKRGYCDYFATAMVVLARSSGLPARFVSGYAPGEYDAAHAEYVIRELHAHSWAEIYFPEIGWIEFEPTGYQPEIVRGETTRRANDSAETREATQRILSGFSRHTLLTYLFPFIVAAFVIISYFAFLEQLIFMRLSPTTAVERLYKRLYRVGRSLAGDRTRAETIHEFTTRLVQRIDDVHTRLKIKASSTTVKADIQQLAVLYQLSMFSNHSIDQGDARLAWKIWSRLRWSLRIEKIKQYLSMRNKKHGDRFTTAM